MHDEDTTTHDLIVSQRSLVALLQEEVTNAVAAELPIKDRTIALGVAIDKLCTLEMHAATPAR